MDKFAIVYEFNSDSPLITYKASKELEAQNYSKARDLLASAIEKYPNHATAYFIYGLSLAHVNEFDKAKEYILIGDKIIKDQSTKEYYLNAVEKIKRESEGISVNFDDTVNEVLEESFLEPEEFDTAKDLELLDDSLIIDEAIIEDSQNQNEIVTETLAEIYASQGNYEEALGIYEKLKDLKPELTDKFDNRITELNLAIETKRQKRFGK